MSRVAMEAIWGTFVPYANSVLRERLWNILFSLFFGGRQKYWASESNEW